LEESKTRCPGSALNSSFLDYIKEVYMNCTYCVMCMAGRKQYAQVNGPAVKRR
jgi:hypothetical protein